MMRNQFISDIEKSNLSCKDNIETLNDLKIGYLRGKLAAEANEDFSAFISAMRSDYPDIRKGFIKGYLMNIPSIQALPIKDSLSLYKKNKSKENYLKFLSSLSKFRDSDYSIYEEDGDYKIGEEYDESDIDDVKSKLDSDDSLEIKSNENGKVVIGKKNDCHLPNPDLECFCKQLATILNQLSYDWDLVGQNLQNNDQINVLICSESDVNQEVYDCLMSDPSFEGSIEGKTIIGSYVGVPLTVSYTNPLIKGVSLVKNNSDKGFFRGLQNLASKQGQYLTDLGLFDESGVLISTPTEKSVFDSLKIVYIPDSLRDF